MTASLPLMKIVLNPSRKNVLIPLVLSAGMSAAIQTKIYGSGTTILIILNDEMEDIMK